MGRPGSVSNELEGAAMRTHQPTLLSVAVALTGALLLTGCGANSQRLAAAVISQHPSATSSSHTSRFNDADVMFAQQMIPHQQQAIQMVQLAASHAQSSKVKALAAKISGEQASEIKTMTGWLHAWGKPVPTAMPRMMSSAPGVMGSPAPATSGPSIPGMVSEAEMSQLMSARGANFDGMFLQMMIQHQEGALEMAKTEQVEGVNPAARKLANQIEVARTAEIAQMQQMLR